MPQLSPPEAVLGIARRLEEAGHETWCVGGAIRDALLGHPHLDWDLATAARPEEVRRLFRRTVPVGIAFGTIGVLDDEGVMHEVTTFRRDVKTDGRHAVVEFGASLDEDLARRDFTVNAIAYSPSRDVVHDPFEGRKDIAGRTIRAVGTGRDRMREDRLRALRALRFASRLGFEVEGETWEAIVESSGHLGRLSAERVKQEIEKTMEQVACPSRAFDMWQRSGALAALIPSLAHTPDFGHLDHVGAPRGGAGAQKRILRIAALFSTSRSEQLIPLIRELRFSNAESNWITAVISGWRTLAPQMEKALVPDGRASDADVRRWASVAGRTRFAHIIRLAAAHWAAARASGRAAPAAGQVASLYRRAVRSAYRDPIEIGDLAVNGSDLEKAGITGPKVGQVLRGLLEIVVESPARNVHSDLLELAASLTNNNNKPRT